MASLAKHHSAAPSAAAPALSETERGARAAAAALGKTVDPDRRQAAEAERVIGLFSEAFGQSA
jgi:hypothetical protein